MKNLFVGLGFQKCATTWLSMRLRRHPQVWAPFINELHFWDSFESQKEHLPLQMHLLEGPAKRLAEKPDREAALTAIDRLAYWRDYQHVVPDGFASYTKLFKPDAGHRAVGEITPAYAGLSTATLQLIKQGAPDAKVFVLMREPIARIWSQIRHEARLRPKEVKTTELMLEYLGSDRMLAQANYHSTLRRVLETFDRRQVGVFFFEDMIADDEAYLRAVCTFLEIDFAPHMVASKDKDKAPSGGEKMPEEVRARAVEMYGHVAREVHEILGHVPDAWLGKTR